MTTSEPRIRIAAIRTVERRAFVELTVPGRVGSLYQDLNTVPTSIVIEGSLYGDEARDEFLGQLRGKFRDGAPVTFVADILTATEVQYVVIETLRIQESGVNPGQTDYRCVLRESPPPPPPPDPLGGLDTSLLNQAAGLADAVTGALGASETCPPAIWQANGITRRSPAIAGPVSAVPRTRPSPSDTVSSGDERNRPGLR